jgi:signal transduction histidine kinase/ligand-binding sensor domain-containing protein
MTWGLREGLPGQSIKSVANDGHGGIIVGMMGEGVARLEGSKISHLVRPGDTRGSSTFALSTLVDHQDRLWVGTLEDGLFVLDPVPHATVGRRRPRQATKGSIYGLFEDSHGNIWIGTRNGLYIVNEKGEIAKHITVDKYDPSSLSGNSIMCFMQDNAGSIWVGTFAGGVSINQPGNDNFSYIRDQLGQQQQGLNCKVISRIIEDKQQNLWVATEGGGLNFIDRKKNTYKYIHVNPVSDHLVNQEIVKAIQLDAKDNVWIGTLEGLFYYNKNTGTMNRYHLAESTNTLFDEQVYGLARDGDNLWVGTKGGLFYLTGKGKLIRYRHKAGITRSIISNEINTIFGDSQGGIWIGTEKGLSYLPKGANEFINYLGDDTANTKGYSILSGFEDNAGRIWIGTRGGGVKLFDKKSNRFYTIDKSFGLPDNIVHGIIQDKQGNMWFSFNQSIAKVGFKKQSLPFSLQDVQVTNYSVNNGLGSNEFLAAVCRTASGEIMFGGVNGIVTFQPEKLVVNKVKRPVVLTDLLIKNTPVTIDGDGSPLSESISSVKEITLTHEQAYFTIRFAALNYINSKTNQYAYTLEGLQGENEWNYVSNQQSATYTNLDAGTYIFKVKAANNDGLWNDAYTAIKIRVLPPIWKTWYAYLFYFLVIGSILYAFYYYSLKANRLKHELQLQQVVNEKEKEFSRQKIDFFTNISHEIKTPLTLVLAPLAKMLSALNNNQQVQHHYLLMMQRNGDTLMKLIDQLLNFRRIDAGFDRLDARSGDVSVFIKNIVDNFQILTQRDEKLLAFETADAPIITLFDEDKLEKIMFNLISNALKFIEPGGKVIVSLSQQKNSIVIKVEDNGIGIASEHLDKIFDMFRHYDRSGRKSGGTGIGLSFTKKLVALHGGTIEVVSRQQNDESEGYTCFSITLPVRTNDEQKLG